MISTLAITGSEGQGLRSLVLLSVLLCLFLGQSVFGGTSRFARASGGGFAWMVWGTGLGLQGFSLHSEEEFRACDSVELLGILLLIILKPLHQGNGL